MVDVKIMVVEDDPEIRDLVTLYLENEGYSVMGVATGSDAIEQFSMFLPSLIILDVLLPDMKGVQVCEHIRKFSYIPVLFVSCMPSSEYIIAGLESGGDDYIVKPFDPAVLLARVKANLRRLDHSKLSEESAYTLKFGDLIIYTDRLEVYMGDQKLSLYSKELQLLMFFAKHPNVVFSTRQLYERVWGWNCESDERTVMVHISNLRKKIETDTPNSPRILTVRGFGYKFVPAEIL